MKKEKMKFYKLEESKSIITFGNSNKKRNSHFIIIKNSIIFSLIFVIMFFSFSMYANNEINNISATIYKGKKDTNEKMNASSNNLATVKINYNEKYEILINKANQISQEVLGLYKQVNVDNNIYPNIKIEETTYKNYLKLKKAVENKGYFLNIRSGFRSFKDSEDIYKQYEIKYGTRYAEKYVAKPGVSEHNTGMAFDIIITSDKNTENNNYESNEYKYLENIAYLYGFIIRYPKDKEEITGYSYEPWHLRYVGKDLAKYLTKNNLTLEEYYENKE